MHSFDVVIVGAGAAGSAAVATLLAHGFAGRLVWLDQEQQPAYDRTALSKFVIAGQMPADEVPTLLEADDLRKGHLIRQHGKHPRLMRSCPPRSTRLWTSIKPWAVNNSRTAAAWS